MKTGRPKYWKSIALALIATLAIAISVSYIPKDMPVLKYVNALVNQRGIGSYGIIFFGLSVTFAAMLAIRRDDYRPRLSYLLLIMSSVPLVCGVAAWQLGLVTTNAWYRTEMAKSPTIEQIAEIELNHASYLGVSFDPMWLALLFFAISFSCSFNHWALIPQNARNVQNVAKNISTACYFKAWSAYFITHASLSLLIGLIVAIITHIIYRYSLGSESRPSQILLLMIGLMISAIISYPLFKWVCKNMILNQARKEDA